MVIAHILPLLLVLAGNATHTLKKLIEVRQQGHALSLIGFLRLRPYKTSLALLGSMAGYLLLVDQGVTSLVAAFGVGYAADSMLEVVGAKARGVIQ
ncbi:hypothetical protein [Halomonas sp. MES3-P3E]|uniref:hypothetical protein n=1 Tax=Halomonas sp. MES3-P3E TaxID=2058321 RepID=UPI000C32F39B|nr:hypothetical protein [Halomonas sp. MES3-P3E]PKG49585.1 hypothetical protein CXF87_12350 [Halomonas sp. MES3-P3E]